MIIVAVILGVVGIVGSILPGLPGPPLSWIGVLLIYFFGGDPMSQTLLFVLLAVTIVVTVVDYLVPGPSSRRSSWAARTRGPRSNLRWGHSWASCSGRASSSSPRR